MADAAEHAQRPGRHPGPDPGIAALLASRRPVRPVFQPVVALTTGHVAGYEALARFPALEEAAPVEVFARARRCGLAGELEAEAIRAALHAARRRPEGTWLSLNASPVALATGRVADALPQDLGDMVVEITEQELTSDDDTLETALAALRARGARVAVDDAGSGYAGLEHLVRTQPDIIKLDRSLVAGVCRRPDKAALIDCFVGFAQRTGALVCAEGIESMDDLAVLADLDVAYGQGFLLARPAPPWPRVAPTVAAELLRWSTEGRAAEFAPFDGSASSDRRLERLVERVCSVGSLADLDGVTELLAEELHADEVILSRWMGGREVEALGPRGARSGERFAAAELPLTRRAIETRVAVQVLAGDPAGDPAEIGLLERLGYRSVLIVPVVNRGRTVGLLEAYSLEDRPWSRTAVNRARIVCYPLAAALDRAAGRVAPGGRAAPWTSARKSSSSELNAAGRSSMGTWPVSARTTFRAPGIARS
jgi:EAL domain-containing protein (putative c-di-GMP-specific phosphodiesterase class I)